MDWANLVYRSGRVIATATVEIVAELAQFRAGRDARRDTLGLSAVFLDLLAPLLAPSETDLRSRLETWANQMVDAIDASCPRRCDEPLRLTVFAGFLRLIPHRHLVAHQALDGAASHR